MTTERVLYANLGAEEDDAPPLEHPPPHLRHLIASWRTALPIADQLGFVTAGLVAWLNTRRAKAAAMQQGLPLYGAEPSVVDVVHDKGFCVHAAHAAGLRELPLENAVAVIDGADCTADRILAVSQQLAVRTPFPLTAKPRRGTSGRGRVDLRRGITSRAAHKLARRGGAVIEPWLPRIADYSSQWWVRDDGSFELLGTTEATQNFAGVWHGARCMIDNDGLPRVPGDVGRDVVDKSFLIVQAAAVAGYVGPCGVDVFLWRDDDGRQWTHLCELNARMTGGLVAVLLARREVMLHRAQPGDSVRYHDDGVVSVSARRTNDDDDDAI